MSLERMNRKNEVREKSVDRLMTRKLGDHHGSTEEGGIPHYDTG